MINYTKNDIKKSLKKINLKKGDLIFVNPETFKFGKLVEAKNERDQFEIFFNIINEIIGPKGTIVSNCYTFQVLRYNKIFDYNNTKTSSGGWSEYLRNLKGSLRSEHPVYSVIAYGYKKKEICSNNSNHNYGLNSPYDKFLKLDGKILNLGMDPELNPFLHVMEYLYGVPYYYNKYTKTKYIKNKKKISKIYSTFVRYLEIDFSGDLSKLKKGLHSIKIEKSNLGSELENSIAPCSTRFLCNKCATSLSALID